MRTPTPIFSPWRPWSERAEARRELREQDEDTPDWAQYGGCYLFGRFVSQPSPGPAVHTVRNVIYIGETQNLMQRPLTQHEVADWYLEIEKTHQSLYFALVTIDEWFRFGPKEFAYLDFLEARLVWEYVKENDEVPRFQLTGPHSLRVHQRNQWPQRTWD